MSTTEQQIENARVAYAIMWGIPSEKIDMSVYREDSNGDENVSRKRLFKECGAVACLGGWLSAHPYFRKQGLRYDPDGAVYIKDENFNSHSAAEVLFGDRDMFEGGPEGLPGKLLALQRLRIFLLEENAISEKKNKKLMKFESRLKE